MAEKKEPMIEQQSRPTAIDYDKPLSELKLRDLSIVIAGHLHTEKELLKSEKEKEHWKPEKEKEYWKPEKEKEVLKGEKEKEHWKPESFKPELFKPESLKPELSKPEKPWDQGLIDQIADRVIEKLRSQGGLK
ncbi:MAG TPA: hypothetical protein VFJ02_16250 [Vicinamibacterales bacterium]|nr:hypothetical protein [Vicinamibacterales bacterium]